MATERHQPATVGPLDPSGQGIAGISSTLLPCLSPSTQPSRADDALASGLDHDVDNPPCPAAGTVALDWQGEAQSARLVLRMGGVGSRPQAAHTILINGRPAALAPLCGVDLSCTSDAEYVYLSVPTALVARGENQIEFTADALTGDPWSATNIRLEVFGPVSPITEVDGPISDPGNEGQEDQAGTLYSDRTNATTLIVTFKNTYDNSDQEAKIQIPTGHNKNNPVPLILYAHGRSGTKDYGIDYLGPEANSRGWLLASPEMHGSWEVPAECYVNPETCDFSDEILTRKPGAYAHASLESQYDIIGAAKYMVKNYGVDPDRIYLVGGSMGGQIATVVSAKFPHLFAAIHEYKGITDLEQWYIEVNNDYDQLTLEKECHIDGTPKTPSENPFCYERRSSTNFGRNYIHIPISIKHSVHDELVPISHAYNLRDAINSFDPDTPATVDRDWTAQSNCDPPYHCFEPDPKWILNWLSPHRLAPNPDDIRIASDESKTYYWMKLTQTGGDHWSYVDVTRDPNSPTVEVKTDDTKRVSIGLNLGSVSQAGEVIPQPGMGLPATTYLLKGAGYYQLVDYTSGYMTTQVNSTGQSTFTISAIKVDVTADPSVLTGEQTETSTVTVEVRDQTTQRNIVPDGTLIVLQTTEGTFPNGKKTLTLTTVSGKATTSVTVTPDDDLATITATVRQASGQATIDVVRPGIDLQISADPAQIYSYEPVTMRYTVLNSGDSTLNSIRVTDDSGSSQPICEGFSLASGQQRECTRQLSLDRTTTIRAQVRGVSLLGETLTDSDSTTVNVIAPNIDLKSTPNPVYVYPGNPIVYTYEIVNTGNAALTEVTVRDDGGNGGDYAVCTGITLQPGDKASCERTINLTQSTTVNSTATARDPRYTPLSDLEPVQVLLITPSIDVAVSPDDQTGYKGRALPYSFSLKNTGNAVLKNVRATHDNGTPQDTGDDVEVCTGITIAPGTQKTCDGTATPPNSGPIVTIANGQDPLGGAVSATDTVQVKVISPTLSMTVAPNYRAIPENGSVTHHYTLVNVGDTRVTGVEVKDDNGTPGFVYDDQILLLPTNMDPGEAKFFQRTVRPPKSLTVTATATGIDPLGNPVSQQTYAQVKVGIRIYMPIVIR
jgi:hypothetical protein